MRLAILEGDRSALNGRHLTIVIWQGVEESGPPVRALDKFELLLLRLAERCASLSRIVGPISHHFWAAAAEDLDDILAVCLIRFRPGVGDESPEARIDLKDLPQLGEGTLWRGREREGDDFSHGQQLLLLGNHLLEKLQRRQSLWRHEVELYQTTNQTQVGFLGAW